MRKPRLLVVEQDPAVARRIIDGIDRICCVADQMVPPDDGCPPRTDCGCGTEAETRSCCCLVSSFEDLIELELDNFDLAICSASLEDVSGLDMLAYLRGTHPELPVVLAGDPADTSMAVEAIAAGALDFIVTSGQGLRTLSLTIEKCIAQHRIMLENERLHRDLSHSIAELGVKNQQLQSLVQQLESMARTDDLTGLHNRRWLNLNLEGSWAEAMRCDLPLAFMMIDLDGFKRVNDLQGHQHGDEILRAAGRLIEANCRQVDTCARYGGDEFCILMRHTEPHEAIMVAERILTAFDAYARSLPRDHPPIGMSIGLAHIDLSRPVNADQLVTHSDEAMYAAKTAGKQRVMVRDAEGVFAPMTRGMDEPDLEPSDGECGRG